MMNNPAIGYASIALLTGIGIPIMAALNSTLGSRLGSPVAASFILFCVAGMVAFAAMAISQTYPKLPAKDLSIIYYCGGFFVAFYVLSITWMAPRFGVGNAVFFVLLGQLIAASLIDHYGLFGAPRSSITPVRTLGIALMATGVFLARRPMI